jgi:hypothetical protein
MNSTFVSTIAELTKQEIVNVVKQLAKHYNFDMDEALRMLEDEPTLEVEKPKEAEKPKETEKPKEVEKPKETEKPKEVEKPKKTKKAKKVQKPKCPFPWTGHVIEGLCQGIRPNHGMLSQCIQPQKAEGFCGTCFKQFQSGGKPKCGTVKDRCQADKDGIEYKNPETGKASVKMVTVLKKLKMTKEEVIAEAEKFGIVIPESEFELVKKTKGRPPTVKPSTKGEDILDEMIAKAISAVSSSSESESDTENAKTNNKKPEPVPEQEAEQDTATPVPAPEPEPKNTDDDNVYDAETEDEDEDVVQVKPFTHNKKEYLIDPSNNILYDKKTHDTVGVWDPKTETIGPYEEVSDDEEE